jgi:hypothetical protein
MAKVWMAFQILNDDESIPLSYQQIHCHIIFGVKMEDFCHKARFVAGGHMTETPATDTYVSVISRESVCIALTLAGLNDLEHKTADIKNAYLTAPVLEKICCVLGPEFGANTGKHAIVVWSLYGLKGTCASFWNHLADYMQHLGWELCIADQDLWMKAEIRPDDGNKFYAFACFMWTISVLHIMMQSYANDRLTSILR